MPRILYDKVITEEEFKQDVITMLYGKNRPKKKLRTGKGKEAKDKEREHKNPEVRSKETTP